jgi:peptidyl-prolyl cis-trans isomerase SurA
MHIVMKIWFAFLICAHSLLVIAQNDEAILFTVEDIDVSLQEFKYIYEKNNRDGADYSEPSLTEYLDLYAKFKLKVKLGKDLQMDTIVALQTELEGYRKQLAKSYLKDKNVTEKLTREAYERMKEDVHISHILFRVGKNASVGDERQVKEKAQQVLGRIRAGESFEALAEELSEDKSTAKTGGDLGFLTAMLPNGFYAMEGAMYSLQPGEISEPVRSPLGYHLIKVNSVRPARGKIEVSHILARIKEDKSNVQAAKSKILGIQKNLSEGQEFEAMARSLSDDQRTAKRGGYIGKISINMYDPVFEEAAYSIANAGEYSEPVKTKIGWHIIKLLKKVQVGDYNSQKRQLAATMNGDERMDIAKRAMIDSIKAESAYQVDSILLNTFIQSLNDDFHSFKWKVPTLPEGDIISFKEGLAKSMSEFVDYVRSHARERMRAQSNADVRITAYELFSDFSDDACLEYEEIHLVEKYPEFAALMREYEEGILLFEVTKMMVWDKATLDTAGLREFFNGRRQKYVRAEQAEVVLYTISTQDEKAALKAYRSSFNEAPEDWFERLNKKETVVAFTRSNMEKEEVETAGWQWTPGWVSPLFTDPGQDATFTRVLSIQPERQKELEETRGYVIADYQDYLETKWVEELSEKYSVVVNEKLFRSLISNSSERK